MAKLFQRPLAAAKLKYFSLKDIYDLLINNSDSIATLLTFDFINNLVELVFGPVDKNYFVDRNRLYYALSTLVILFDKARDAHYQIAITSQTLLQTLETLTYPAESDINRCAAALKAKLVPGQPIPSSPMDWLRHRLTNRSSLTLHPPQAPLGTKQITELQTLFTTSSTPAVISAHIITAKLVQSLTLSFQNPSTVDVACLALRTLSSNPAYAAKLAPYITDDLVQSLRILLQDRTTVFEPCLVLQTFAGNPACAAELAPYITDDLVQSLKILLQDRNTVCQASSVFQAFTRNDACAAKLAPYITGDLVQSLRTLLQDPQTVRQASTVLQAFAGNPTCAAKLALYITGDLVQSLKTLLQDPHRAYLVSEVLQAFAGNPACAAKMREIELLTGQISG